MQKIIDNFIQNCHTCKQHNLHKQSYSYVHMKPPKDHLIQQPVTSLAPFTLNSDVLLCMCHLTKFPVAIPIPNKRAETFVQAH